ncbi:MAG: hypothetical protein NZ555_09905 [Geminicoccaceae bacterium]|nr:hypothetical protein [Geminicoccaceae bacterium]MCX8102290.1 Rap1a/Tai family immunity protein [Geminicoccaceae bacterium]MDW8369370.1 Rap1a/Tai family immunity protein [Geminicoccaceae bacterium]
MVKRTICAAAATVAIAGGAWAQPVDPKLETTRALLELCGTEPGAPRYNARISYCEGFIAGTGLLYEKLVDAGAIKPWACAPAAPSADEIRSAFVKWARANPRYLDEPPVDGFWRAMAATWPCPEQPARAGAARKKS